MSYMITIGNVQDWEQTGNRMPRRATPCIGARTRGVMSFLFQAQINTSQPVFKMADLKISSAALPERRHRILYPHIVVLPYNPWTVRSTSPELTWMGYPLRSVAPNTWGSGVCRVRLCGSCARSSDRHTPAIFAGDPYLSPQADGPSHGRVRPWSKPAMGMTLGCGSTRMVRCSIYMIMKPGGKHPGS